VRITDVVASAAATSARMTARSARSFASSVAFREA